MNSSLSIEGRQQSGKDIRKANAHAVMSIANILRSSLGPQGLDKMIVDEIGELTITNDGATILKKLQITHPASNILVQLAQIQDLQIGDGTTSVVLLAAQLLKKGQQLITINVHPTTIISGFKLAAKEACRFMEDWLAVSVDKLGEEAVRNCAGTTLASKMIGAEWKFFAKLAIDAIMTVKQKGINKDIYQIKSINTIKIHGKSILQSQLIPGYALNTLKAHQQMPSLIKNAKIACIDFNLTKFKLSMGMQVLLNDPRNLQRIRDRQCNILKQRIKKILNAGTNVIITTMGIDQLATKYLVEHKCIGLRRIQRNDLLRIAQLTGATVVTSMATMDGQQSFEQEFLGECEQVAEECVGENDLIFFKGCKQVCASTIILRGANEWLLDQIERSIHDVLCVLKKILESGQVVAGGGAVEVALSIRLEEFCKRYCSMEQIAIFAFSQALNVIPKTLATNAAKDAIELISKLRTLHAASQRQCQADPKKLQLKYCGLDLHKGKPRDNIKAGILQPLISKISSIKLATEAAITILRIDDMISIQRQQQQEIAN